MLPLPVKPQVTEQTRNDEQYRVFLARVVRVDYESKTVSLRDRRNGQIYDDVSAIPATASSFNSTDVVMPEVGSFCLATPLEWFRGSSQYAVLTYITSDTVSGINAVAHRPVIDFDSHIPGWTDRTRGVYRKAYPGQQTIVRKEGYVAKFDSAWDMSASDFSRDRVDPLRQTRISTTGRSVNRNEAVFSTEGPVNRPDSDIPFVTLPDGTKEWILTLSNKKWTDRHTEGSENTLALVESTQKIQEFALDYALPQEALDRDVWESILGLTQPLASQTKILRDENGVAYDDQSQLINQTWDHPTKPKLPGVGPTLNEAPTPRRKGWIIEKSEGTLVGSNKFDMATYGKVLKPTVFPLTKAGRFASSVESTYLPVAQSSEQVETRMAASAFSIKFPYEYNTTRFDITKEGLVVFEIGSTIPKENTPWDNQTYEHPHGAGRSLEGNLLGSVKLVVGKNRDEEESIDLQTVGGAVVRLGADDSSLPQWRRYLQTQIRGQKDQLADRNLQFWRESKLKPGDAGDPLNKTGAENVSLRSALDGGIFLRVGAREKGVKRRHLKNGYKDARGVEKYSIGDPGREDARSDGRPMYGAGDSHYRFHDLSKAGAPTLKGGKGIFPYNTWSGSAGDPENLGLSADIHLVRDILLRVGSNEGVSASLDLAGSILAAIGKDSKGRSLVGALDGGVELTVGKNKQGKGLRLEIDGDVDVVINGNLHLNVTGDITAECNRRTMLAKISDITKGLIVQHYANTLLTNESPEIVSNQGQYRS